MDAVVALLLHKYELPPEAVSVVLLPIQIDVPPEIEAIGSALTCTNLLATAEQPPALVTVTVYVVLTEGLTEIAAVV